MKTTGKNWKPTGGELVRFWGQIGQDGRLNPNTASAVRGACKRVLSVLPHWDSFDVRQIDPEKTLNRFAKKWKDRLSPETIESYKKRFSYGLEYFLRYLKDPLDWDPGFLARNAGPTQSSYSLPEAESNTVVEHRFPLRNNLDVLLALPRDLNASEAFRLSAYLRTLAIDVPASTRTEALNWPAGYFDQTYGSFRDGPLERGEQGKFETREELE